MPSAPSDASDRLTFDAVVILRHLALTFSGNISPVTTQAPTTTISVLTAKDLECVIHTRPKCRGEEEDEDTDERELRARRRIIRTGRRNAACSDDVLRNTHSKRTNKQDWSASEAVDRPKPRECCDNVDRVRDDLQYEGAGQIRLTGKVGSAVIEYKVDADLRELDLFTTTVEVALTSCCKH